MVNEKYSKGERVAYILSLLLKHEQLKKIELAEALGVDERTIQRDFREIENGRLLANQPGAIVYNSATDGHTLIETAHPKSALQKEEVLAIVKVLLESRAFPKKDLKLMIDKLIYFVAKDDQELIEKRIMNEFMYYVELTNNHTPFDKLWKLTEAIQKQQVARIYYRKEHDKIAQPRDVHPLGLVFSEYYFYLIACRPSDETLAEPIIYRVDRMTDVDLKRMKFKIPERYRFEEGDFRKKVQYMYNGNLERIVFRFSGPSPQAVLDRLPTARRREDGTFEAEVFGTGVKMWLLSQGSNVEVLEPASFRAEMIAEIEKTLERYKQVTLV